MQRLDQPPRARQRLPGPGPGPSRWPMLIAALSAAALTIGCQDIRRDPFGAITITVKPGDTGRCAINPCRILFEMPPGEDAFQVRGNQIDFGRYPAGRTVNLGDFYEPQAIQVVGADVPKTYVYIPVDW